MWRTERRHASGSEASESCAVQYGSKAILNLSRLFSARTALLEKRQLLPKEQILGDEDDAGAKGQPDEGEQLRILKQLATCRCQP